MFIIGIVVVMACAVLSEDASNYYVVQMPSEDASVQLAGRRLQVYWNVPTIQCKSKRIPFEDLERFGIMQNANDSFRGETVAILYDPGVFPALLKNETSGHLKFRNGGVPQEGDLQRHLAAFRRVMNESVPDRNFQGVGIIDFESWRPVYRQNFGVLSPYKDVSYEIERRRHWWWTKAWLQAEAQRRFEEAAVLFMRSTLAAAKEMRPRARWGYYGFPYCFNMAGNHLKEKCADHVPEENDRIIWLWSDSTALYPSVYSSSNLSADQLAKLIRGRLSETRRVVRNNAPILPYFWFKYREGGLMSEKDLKVSLETLYRGNSTGLIIWGSSNDVNTKDKCLELLDYVNTVLGPAVAKYAKKTNSINYDVTKDIILNTTSENNLGTHTTDHPDPEFHWVPPENYTDNIKSYVKKEFGEKLLNKSENNVNVTNDVIVDNLKESSLISLIAGFLFHDNSTENIDVSDLDLVNNDTITIVSSTNKGESQLNDSTKNSYSDESTTTEENYDSVYASTTEDTYSPTISITEANNNPVDFLIETSTDKSLLLHTVNSAIKTITETQQDYNSKENDEKYSYDITTKNYKDTNFQSKNNKKGHPKNRFSFNLNLTTDKTMSSSSESVINSTDITIKSENIIIKDEIISTESFQTSTVSQFDMNMYEVIKLRHSKNKRKGLALHKNNNNTKSEFISLPAYDKQPSTELPTTTTLDKDKTHNQNKSDIEVKAENDNNLHNGMPKLKIMDAQDKGNISSTTYQINTSEATIANQQIEAVINGKTDINKFTSTNDSTDMAMSNSDVYNSLLDMNTAATDKVAGSSGTIGTNNNRQKYFICIIYFYSISKCLCYVYHHCV